MVTVAVVLTVVLTVEVVIMTVGYDYGYCYNRSSGIVSVMLASWWLCDYLVLFGGGTLTWVCGLWVALIGEGAR